MPVAGNFLREDTLGADCDSGPGSAPGPTFLTFRLDLDSILRRQAGMEYLPDAPMFVWLQS